MIQALALAVLELVTTNGVVRSDFATYPTGALDHATNIAGMVVEASHKHRVDPLLYTALIYRESRFRRDALSHKASFGYSQLNRKFHRDVWNTCQARVALCDWLVIDRGARVLAWYLRKCNGDSKGVTAYRLGYCAAAGPETRKVLVIRQWLRKQTKGSV